MTNNDSGKEHLGKQVEVLFEEGKGRKHFYSGIVKKVEFSLKGKKNTVVSRYFVVFDDGEKKWFDFDDLTERGEIRWPTSDDQKDDGNRSLKRPADESGKVSEPKEKKMKPNQDVEKVNTSEGDKSTETKDAVEDDKVTKKKDDASEVDKSTEKADTDDSANADKSEETVSELPNTTVEKSTEKADTDDSANADKSEETVSELPNTTVEKSTDKADTDNSANADKSEETVSELPNITGEKSPDIKEDSKGADE